MNLLGGALGLGEYLGAINFLKIQILPLETGPAQIWTGTSRTGFLVPVKSRVSLFGSFVH